MSGSYLRLPQMHPTQHFSIMLGGLEKQSHRRYDDTLLRMLFLEQLVLLFDELQRTVESKDKGRKCRALRCEL